MDAITTLLQPLGVPIYEGYPATGARAPYIVHRPLLVNPVVTATCGQPIAWFMEHTVYCCAASVGASHHLAMSVLSTLAGAPYGGSVLTASIDYSAALVEGLYETQVAVSSEQPGLT